MAPVETLEPVSTETPILPPNSLEVTEEQIIIQTGEPRASIDHVLATKAEPVLPGKTMFEQMAAPAINGKTYPGTELSIADTPEGRKIFRLLEIIDHANSQIVADLPQQREVEELAGQLNPILHSTVIDLARTWLKQIRSAPRMP